MLSPLELNNCTISEISFHLASLIRTEAINHISSAVQPAFVHFGVAWLTAPLARGLATHGQVLLGHGSDPPYFSWQALLYTELTQKSRGHSCRQAEAFSCGVKPNPNRPPHGSGTSAHLVSLGQLCIYMSGRPWRAFQFQCALGAYVRHLIKG
ncbi:hypothetical protein EYF80_003035 [Liparis tanakae]|uniref:Uncharacterized protein n=1 Tax=Liparis tanakae TaxID=230148 RepID=A0A4Z2JBZ9_9TELE|nr:hypothetical protein EYF80_003035 [Liparis tanakae]